MCRKHTNVKSLPWRSIFQILCLQVNPNKPWFNFCFSFCPPQKLCFQELPSLSSQKFTQFRNCSISIKKQFVHWKCSNFFSFLLTPLLLFKKKFPSNFAPSFFPLQVTSNHTTADVPYSTSELFTLKFVSRSIRNYSRTVPSFQISSNSFSIMW